MSSHSHAATPRLRSVLTTLVAAVLALGYDAVSLLPLWAVHVPRHVAAAVQHRSEALRLVLALSSFAALWWGLYGVYGAGRSARSGRADRGLLWSAAAVVLALLVLPGLFPGP